MEIEALAEKIGKNSGQKNFLKDLFKFQNDSINLNNDS
jgi:hypothetical protein